jgi:hypothetical protein
LSIPLATNCTDKDVLAGFIEIPHSKLPSNKENCRNSKADGDGMKEKEVEKAPSLLGIKHTCI